MYGRGEARKIDAKCQLCLAAKEIIGIVDIICTKHKGAPIHNKNDWCGDFKKYDKWALK